MESHADGYCDIQYKTPTGGIPGNIDGGTDSPGYVGGGINCGQWWPGPAPALPESLDTARGGCMWFLLRGRDE